MIRLFFLEPQMSVFQNNDQSSARANPRHAISNLLRILPYKSCWLPPSTRLFTSIRLSLPHYYEQVLLHPSLYAPCMSSLFCQDALQYGDLAADTLRCNANFFRIAAANPSASTSRTQTAFALIAARLRADPGVQAHAL